MRNFLIAAIFVGKILNNNDSLVNTKWACDVTQTCITTLKFKTNKRVDQYNCEIDHTIHGTYNIIRDTLTVTFKDDSHSELGGKSVYYRVVFLVTKDNLYAIGNGELIKGIWKNKVLKLDKSVGYYKINNAMSKTK
jgi:hypothetical protein